MENMIKKRIGRVPLANGFEFKNCWVWGSSVVKDDSGYHMLAKDMGNSICGEHHTGILCNSNNGIDCHLDASPWRIQNI